MHVAVADRHREGQTADELVQAGILLAPLDLQMTIVPLTSGATIGIGDIF